MKKYFISSDIHGFYFRWMDALKVAGFDLNNKDHVIVVLGDLLDRGKQAVECLKFVNSLPPYRKILIRGNHEDLMDHMITHQSYSITDIMNGTYDSLQYMSKWIVNNCPDENLSNPYSTVYHSHLWQDYISQTVDYYELGNNVFVHGWIPCKIEFLDGVEKFSMLHNWKSGNWYDARWINGMNAWSNGVVIPNKTVWCGHWHVSWGWSNIRHQGSEFDENFMDSNGVQQHPVWDPFVDDGIVAVDACTAATKRVNVITLDENNNIKCYSNITRENCN